MKGLELWDKVERTNPSHTKPIKFGRSITTIDPYHQIKNATEQFGPAGQGWGWEVMRVDIFETKEVSVLVRVWIKDQGFIEHFGQSGLYTDNAQKKKDPDHMKKATTDGLTKCLSCMGFNADVFLGKFDDNKYVQKVTADIAKEEAQAANDLRTANILSVKKTADAIKAALDSGQNELIAPLWSELSKDQKQFIWIDVSHGGHFDGDQRKLIIDILPKNGAK